MGCGGWAEGVHKAKKRKRSNGVWWVGGEIPQNQDSEIDLVRVAEGAQKQKSNDAMLAGVGGRAAGVLRRTTLSLSTCTCKSTSTFSTVVFEF